MPCQSRQLDQRLAARSPSARRAALTSSRPWPASTAARHWRDRVSSSGRRSLPVASTARSTSSSAHCSAGPFRSPQADSPVTSTDPRALRVLELLGLERLDRARVHLTDVHPAGHGEGLEPALQQPHPVLNVDARRRRRPLGLPVRRPIAATEALGELLPALLDPLPQLGVLRDDPPRQIGPVGDVPSLVALGELQSRLETGELAERAERLFPAVVPGNRGDALDELVVDQACVQDGL